MNHQNLPLVFQRSYSSSSAIQATFKVKKPSKQNPPENHAKSGSRPDWSAVGGKRTEIPSFPCHVSPMLPIDSQCPLGSKTKRQMTFSNEGLVLPRREKREKSMICDQGLRGQLHMSPMIHRTSHMHIFFHLFRHFVQLPISRNRTCKWMLDTSLQVIPRN